MNPPTATRAAFTLIELLVVIAILAVLIAILYPVATRQFETAKRAVCKTRLEQLGIGLTSYAGDHGGSLPGHQARLDSLGQGVYAVYSRSWRKLPEIDRYRGNGVLYHLDYIQAKFLYCPSWSHPFTQHGKVNPTSYRGGPIWKLADMPSHQYWMQTAYAYRGAKDLIQSGRPRSPHLFKDSPFETPIVADHFSDPRRGVNFHHKEGYNVLYLDGSVGWVRDVGFEIWNYNGGFTYHAGASRYRLQEEVWYKYFTRN